MILFLHVLRLVLIGLFLADLGSALYDVKVIHLPLDRWVWFSLGFDLSMIFYLVCVKPTVRVLEALGFQTPASLSRPHSLERSSQDHSSEPIAHRQTDPRSGRQGRAKPGTRATRSP